jgi:hypothetical protein
MSDSFLKGGQALLTVELRERVSKADVENATIGVEEPMQVGLSSRGRKIADKDRAVVNLHTVEVGVVLGGNRAAIMGALLERRAITLQIIHLILMIITESLDTSQLSMNYHAER